MPSYVGACWKSNFCSCRALLTLTDILYVIGNKECQIIRTKLWLNLTGFRSLGANVWWHVKHDLLCFANGSYGIVHGRTI